MEPLPYTNKKPPLTDAQSSICKLLPDIFHLVNDLPTAEIDGARDTVNQQLEALHALGDVSASTLGQAAAGLSEAYASLDGAQTDLREYAAGIETPPEPETDTPLGISSPSNLKPGELISVYKAFQAKRKNFQKTRGFALFTEVNQRLLEELRQRPLTEADFDVTLVNQLGIYEDGAQKIVRNNPGGVSLLFAAHHLNRGLPHVNHMESYGVTPEDITAIDGDATFSGFGDLDFPLYFSAAIANAVMDDFIGKGLATRAQKDALTLTGWADMIGSEWFGQLIHAFALTANGIYARFGAKIIHLAPDDLAAMLRDKYIAVPDGSPFDCTARTSSKDGSPQVTAQLKPEIIKGLRERMHAAENSTGCPVARKATMLPKSLIQADLHTRALLNNGTLRLDPRHSTDTHIRVLQDRTAIDDTLALFAEQLRSYDRLYGTPRIQAQPHPAVSHIRPGIVS